MIQLNDQYLESLGFTNLSDPEKSRITEDLSAIIVKRVGINLASKLDDAELESFDQELTDSWLKEKFPNYEEVVVTELEALKVEVLAEAKALQ